MTDRKGLAPLLIALAAGCSSSPPHELVTARSAYDQASQGPAGSLDPVDLHLAAERLDSAEHSFNRDGPSQDTKDLAYAAERRAQIAQVRADAVSSVRQRNALLAAYGERQAAELQQTRSELDSAHQQLVVEQAQTRDAELRAAGATAALVHVATVRQERRDVVVTLSSNVFFGSASADLLPEARSKLGQIAGVLAKDAPPDHPNRIVVRGYTDAGGLANVNQDLSQRRAEVVRDFLAMYGVPGDRITAVGHVLSDPFAENGTAEGRADNRRVEIVIQPAETSSDSGPSNESRP
jgi:outer membrane protein OmpA-like peptidoglycan-associated protein